MQLKRLKVLAQLLCHIGDEFNALVECLGNNKERVLGPRVKVEVQTVTMGTKINYVYGGTGGTRTICLASLSAVSPNPRAEGATAHLCLSVGSLLL
jgi:hypothetical protein